MRAAGSHQYPAMDSVIYGKPAAEALREEAERLDARRVFLIASRTLNTGTDEIEKIRASLGDRYAGTFDGIPQHTTREVVVQAAAHAREAGADLIVAIGGGSVVDAAKIILMCIEHEIVDQHGLDGYETTPERRFGAFRNPKVRMIAIPGTLSGGEYNSGSLVTDTRRKLKQIFNHPMMMPRTIILDPAITRYTPEKLWLGSGTRAMDHGIEAICSIRGNPLVDSVCLSGLRFLHDGLLRTKANPDDAQARIATGLHLLGPDMTLQAPPNLQPGALAALVRAGVNDWGGVSPLTPDHVNPERPWPQIDALSAGGHEIAVHLFNRVRLQLAWALRLERIGDDSAAAERIATASAMAIWVVRASPCKRPRI